MDDTLGPIEFTTDRLDVGPWHDQAELIGTDLVAVVVDLLTERTTAALPESWRGAFDTTRAAAWIAARDAESPTLLATDRTTQRPVALTIVVGVPDGRDDLDLRIGYVVAESAWGRGIASELLAGLVRWAHGRDDVASVTGGVALGNVASIRVLEKCGFRAVEQDATSTTYRLDLRRTD